MRTKKLVTTATIVALTAGACFAGATSASAAEDPGYTKLATNTAITAQKTASGQTVKDLYLKDGELYTGYGDYDQNTGNINVASVNVGTNKVTNWLAVPTEELSNYKEINGKLYAPEIDPRNLAWNANVGYATNASGKWTVNNVTPFIHVFDVASSDGKDLWLVGSISDAAGKLGIGSAVKRSVDGGKTWTTERTASSKPASELDRNYWIQNVNGKIYTRSSATDFSTGVASNAPIEYWENGKWNSFAVPADVVPPNSSIGQVVFKNNIFYVAGGGVNVIDTAKNTVGVANQSFAAVTRDLYVSGDFIYALTSAGIWKSSDGYNWGLANTTLPANSNIISLAVDTAAKKVYLGGAKGEVFTGKLSDKVTAAPLISGLTSAVVPAGSTFDLMAGVTAKDETGDLTAGLSLDPGDFDTFAPGTYTVTYYVDSPTGLYSWVPRTITVTPATVPAAPVIRGADAAYVLEGNPVDLTYGVKALDTMEGNITSKMTMAGTVDTTKPGKYQVTYSVTNASKLTTTVTRTYLVIKSTPTILGADNKSFIKGTAFDPKAGVTAYDAFAGGTPENEFKGDITSQLTITGTVNVAVPGTYKVNYSFTNALGLTTSIDRIITVTAPQAPVITGAGAATVTVGKVFNAKTGVVVKDAQDGDITAKLVVTGTVNLDAVGAYKLIYTATNSYGVVTTVERVVTVVPNSAPVIKHNITAALARNADYNPQTAVTVTDADKDRIVQFTVSSNVDTSKAGVYSTTYMVTDSAGQVATQKFDITVK